MAQLISRLQTLIAELKRRNVFRVASVYALTAWAASLGAAELLPAFGAPEWSIRLFVLFALLGLPIAVVLAWAYEITPGGIQRDATAEPSALAGGRRLTADSTTVLSESGMGIHVSWSDAGGHHERVFRRDFRIGRDDGCELHLDDPMISRRHVEVSFADGLWWIRDLGSRNGTLLDGRSVTRAPLPAICRVRLHEAAPEIRLEVKSSSRAQTVAAAVPGPPER
jgi:hypothetical protein